jgi:putative ABC transport system ATP-binding protein
MPKRESFIKKLLSFYRPDARDIVVIITYAFLAGVLFLVVPIAASSLVTTIAFGRLLQPLIILSIFVLGGLLIVGALKFTQVRLVELVQQRLFVRQGALLSQKLPTIQYDFLCNNHVPDLVNRFLEVVIIQKVTAQMLMDGAAVVFQVLMGLILISFYHPLLLAYGLVLTLLISLIFISGYGASSTAIDESTSKYEFLQWLEDVARFPLLFKTSWGESLALRKADQLLINYLKTRRGHFRILQRQYLSAYMVQAIAVSFLLILGGWLVMLNQLTLGQLVSAEIVVSAAVYSVSKLGKTFESLYDLIAAINKLDDLHNLPSEKEEGTIALPDSGPLSVEFDEVTSRLKDSKFAAFTLNIPAGSKIAIFGRNASGKSTVANYLLRLVKPAAGQIRINGIDVRDISTYSLRSRIQLVRGYEILHGTIEDNVACLRPHIGTEEVLDALDRVGLLKVVQALPEGVRTNLSAAGAPLSTGQCAQLILARAIVGKPGLIILDQTLDTIDPQSMGQIYQTLLRTDAPWTLIALTSDAMVWTGIEQHYYLSTAGLEKFDSGTVEEQISRLNSWARKDE